MNKRSVGTAYEERAASYLQGLGYRILERSFRTRHGEIDLIAADRGTVVFIEVKYRKDSRTGSPLEAVTPRKQKTISDTALYYISKMRFPEGQEYRFDVIGFCGERLEHIMDAFPFRG